MRQFILMALIILPLFSAYTSEISVINCSSTPAQNETQKFIKRGSTKKEVLLVQGAPNSTSKYTILDDIHDTWFYGGDSVHFKNGRVESWSNHGNSLKINLLD